MEYIVGAHHSLGFTENFVNLNILHDCPKWVELDDQYLRRYVWRNASASWETDFGWSTPTLNTLQNQVSHLFLEQVPNVYAGKWALGEYIYQLHP